MHHVIIHHLEGVLLWSCLFLFLTLLLLLRLSGLISK
jgi:hypothetical protein